MSLTDDYQAELDELLMARSRILASGEEFNTQEIRKRYPTLKSINDRIDQLRMLIARGSGSTVTGPLFRGRW